MQEHELTSSVRRIERALAARLNARDPQETPPLRCPCGTRRAQWGRLCADCQRAEDAR